jgi:hypothetical protein
MSFPYFVQLAPEAIYQEYENKPCPIGTLGMDQFGSLYRLCKAGAAISIYDGIPVANANFVADGYAGDGATVDLYGDTASVGDIVIAIDDLNNATTRPVDHYEGGYVQLLGANTTERQSRRIVSSTVGDGTCIYLTLDAPLTTAITDGAVDCIPSQYSNCVAPQAEANAYETFVAFPRVEGTITSGYYFWGLTRGPVMAHYRNTFPGEAVSDKDCYFDRSGFIDSAPNVQGTFGSVSPQRAGYLIPCNTSAYGSTFIFLQLE